MTTFNFICHYLYLIYFATPVISYHLFCAMFNLLHGSSSFTFTINVVDRTWVIVLEIRKRRFGETINFTPNQIWQEVKVEFKDSFNGLKSMLLNYLLLSCMTYIVYSFSDHIKPLKMHKLYLDLTNSTLVSTLLDLIDFVCSHLLYSTSTQHYWPFYLLETQPSFGFHETALSTYYLF